MTVFAKLPCRLRSAYLILGVLFCFVALPGWCNQTEPCGFPPSLKNVASLLSLYTAEGKPASGAQEALARNLRATDQKQVFAMLYPVGLVDQWGQIERLLETAEQTVRSGFPGDRAQLAGMLAAVARLDQMICTAHSANIEGDRVSGASGGFGNRENRRSLFWWLRPETAAQKASFAFLSAAMAIGMLFVLDLLYQRVFSLLYNRQACRIPATFEADLDVIDGYVVVLGRQNCRFQPVNRGAFVRLAALSIQPNSAIFFGTERHTVTFESLGNGSGLYRFTPKLSLNVQHAILEKSLISPTPASHVFNLQKTPDGQQPE